ncbi:hypothetical protein ACFV0O_27075 [Kitasatospora sp. NPDC059577]
MRELIRPDVLILDDFATDFTTEQAATDIGATWSRYSAERWR